MAGLKELMKFIFKPSRTDPSLLAQFYYADEEVQNIVHDLEQLDHRNRSDPTISNRTNLLIQQYRFWQDVVLTLVFKVMDEIIPNGRASRDYRVKFPDDIVQEGFNGQVWFAAECLAAGSNIANHEAEGELIRPLARTFVSNLDTLRGLLRDKALSSSKDFADNVKDALITFDRIFTTFEFAYISSIIKLKTAKEFDHLQDLIVLFSESVRLAVNRGLITIDQIECSDPMLMFAIPRLAIVYGLNMVTDGPLHRTNTDQPYNLFRPFRQLIGKIKEILVILTDDELADLEQMLCNKAAPGSYQNTCFEYLSGRGTSNSAMGSGSSCSGSTSNNTSGISSSSSTHRHHHRSKSGSRRKSSRATNAIVSGMLSSSSTAACPTTEATSAATIEEPSSRVGETSEQSPAPIHFRDRASSATESTSGLCATVVDSNSDINVPGAAHQQKIRSRFTGRADMLHRLFVCIAGVSDQLQSNSAGEMRFILKTVFQMHTGGMPGSSSASITSTLSPPTSAVQSPSTESSTSVNLAATIELPPNWVPDAESMSCSACAVSFTFLRRRHHCRACGRIFCATCSHRSLALPRLGIDNAVRVCDACYARYAVPPAAIAAAQHILPVGPLPVQASSQ